VKTGDSARYAWGDGHALKITSKENEMTVWTFINEIFKLLYRFFVPVLFAWWLYTITHNFDYATWAYILITYFDLARR
jgi:hypothetical protein